MTQQRAQISREKKTTAVILCPGPSFRTSGAPYRSSARFDHCIAVNDAGPNSCCDWWVAVDHAVIRRNAPQMHPCKLMTNRVSVDALSAEGSSWADSGGVLTDELRKYADAVPTFTNFSSVCALVLASFLGATEIIAIGIDWTPEEHSETRTAERFDHERTIWNEVTAWLTSRGVVVKRIEGGT